MYLKMPFQVLHMIVEPPIDKYYYSIPQGVNIALPWLGPEDSAAQLNSLD